MARGRGLAGHGHVEHAGLVGLALVLAALYPRRVTSLGAAASWGMTVVIAVALVLAAGIVVVAFSDMGVDGTKFQLSLAGSSGPRTRSDLKPASRRPSR